MRLSIEVLNAVSYVFRPATSCSWAVIDVLSVSTSLFNLASLIVILVSMLSIEASFTAVASREALLLSIDVFRALIEVS